LSAHDYLRIILGAKEFFPRSLASLKEFL